MLTSRSVLRALVIASALVVTTQAPGQSTATRQTSARPTQLPAATYKPEFGTMWTFDAPPLDYWRRTYNLSLISGWTTPVFVRAPPQVLRRLSCATDTNHHRTRLHGLLLAGGLNYIETGFSAGTLADEKMCDRTSTSRSRSRTTTRVRSAITGKSVSEQSAQRATIVAQIQTNAIRRRGSIARWSRFIRWIYRSTGIVASAHQTRDGARRRHCVLRRRPQ